MADGTVTFCVRWEIGAALAGVDIQAWVRSGRYYGRFLQFCTIPVVQSRTTARSFRNVVSFEAATSDQLVMLRLTSGAGDRHPLPNPGPARPALRPLR